MSNNENGKTWGFLSRMFGAKNVASHQITEREQQDAMTDGLSISMLLGSTKQIARNRQQIYQKRIEMVSDPIVSTALRLHVTAALGGHETSGDVVFLEDNPAFKGDKAKAAMVEEIRTDLCAIFNRIAYTAGFNGAGFGDAYGRVYTDGKRGVVDVLVDEIVHPAMVTSYERGNTTVGFVVAAGPRFTGRLSLMQMARLKMPRMVYIPQVRAMEKAIKLALDEDDINELPLLPSLVGGSFLDSAEDPYDMLSTALVGLSGQRILDSMDESLITVNMDGVTKEQRKSYMMNLQKILMASKQRAEAAIANRKPFLQRIYNLLPVYGEKQLAAVAGSLTGGSGRGQSGTISIEDVMFYAKLLSAALGIDLSMLGFAELLSGGLGDGGFFRTSAQAAERSRLLRVGLTEFFNQIIDIHTYHKYGTVFAANERPWVVNFYGTISALETEKQKTKTEAMNSGMMLTQTLAQLRDLRMKKPGQKEILTKIMLLDEEQADLIVENMTEPPAEDGGGGFGEGGGGGGGFGDGGGFPGAGKPGAGGNAEDDE
jgi:hypothetical protein